MITQKKTPTALILVLLVAAIGIQPVQAQTSYNKDIFDSIRNSDFNTLNTLLVNGEDVNQQDKSKNTPLMLAAKYGHVHVVEQLLLFGADPLIKNNTGIRASRFASVYKHKEVYQMLVDAENEALKGLKGLKTKAKAKTAS